MKQNKIMFFILLLSVPMFFYWNKYMHNLHCDKFHRFDKSNLNGKIRHLTRTSGGTHILLEGDSIEYTFVPEFDFNRKITFSDVVIINHSLIQKSENSRTISVINGDTVFTFKTKVNCRDSAN